MLKGKGGEAKGAKSHAKGPKPTVPPLALPLELGREDYRAISRRRSGSHPSCFYWIYGDMILV